MQKLKLLLVVATTVLMTAHEARAYTFTSLGRAGGWDDINHSTTVTAVIDQSDLTKDVTALQASTAVTAALQTWDNVAGAKNLNVKLLADNGGNYDAFDGPNDSAGPTWFNG